MRIAFFGIGFVLISALCIIGAAEVYGQTLIPKPKSSFEMRFAPPREQDLWQQELRQRVIKPPPKALPPAFIERFRHGLWSRGQVDDGGQVALKPDQKFFRFDWRF